MEPAFQNAKLTIQPLHSYDKHKSGNEKPPPPFTLVRLQQKTKRSTAIPPAIPLV